MKQSVWNFLYDFFPKHGHQLLPSGALYDWQRQPELGTGSVVADGPETRDSQLRPDNPRLAELRKRYAAFDKQATTPLVWSPGCVTEKELRGFRGADIYVWQSNGLNYGLMAHALAYHYLRSHDELGLLARMDDDAAFSVRRFDVDGRKVSRDLLD